MLVALAIYTSFTRLRFYFLARVRLNPMKQVLESSADSVDGQHRWARKLGLFALFNAMLLSIAAITDESTPKFVAESFIDQSLHNYWVLVEACTVLAMVYVVGRLAHTFVPRVGFSVAVSLIASMPLLWYGDRLARISLQDGLLSSVAMNQLRAFAPYVGDYTTLGTFTKFVISGFAFIAVETCFLWIANRLACSSPSQPAIGLRGSRPVAAGLLLAAMIVLLFALRSPTHVASVYRSYPVRHPLCMLGIVDALMPPPYLISSSERIELESHLSRLGKRLDRVEQRYKDLEIALPDQQPPDIVLIMAESMRHDAIELPHAPNLVQFRESAITSPEHYSGGNATEYGMFTLLTGLDPALMDRGRHWPAAFPKLMKQAGYLTVFLGSGPYQWMGMSDFVRSADWDIYRDEQDVFPFYVRDARYVEHAFALLQRNREAADHDGPVCIFFCPYTTHWDYHFAAQDEVHTPSLQGDLWWPPNPQNDLTGLKNRYLNSIHALDRVIKPLLNPDHVVIFLGDHGEAMFDYGNQLVHANSLSPAQTRTPLIFGIPGVDPRVVRQPTSHCDVLPTLLDVIGSPVNHQGVFSGKSLLTTEPTTRRFSLFNGKNKACGLFAPYAKHGDKLNLVQWSNLHLWDATLGNATVHQESGEFKQTFGGIKEAFLSDFDAWLEAILDDHSERL